MTIAYAKYLYYAVILFYLKDFCGIKIEYKILELNDYVLPLVLILQKLMATKEGGGRGSDVNGQMPLRNSKIFCRCSLTYFSLLSN